MTTVRPLKRLVVGCFQLLDRYAVVMRYFGSTRWSLLVVALKNEAQRPYHNAAAASCYETYLIATFRLRQLAPQ